MGNAEVVKEFFSRMQARDWEGAGQLLAPDVRIEFTETGEQFLGADFLAMNREYPEGWSLKVVETIGAADRVAAQVRVEHGDEVFWCAGFYSVKDGVIASGVEHWVSEHSQDAPAWREKFSNR